MVAILNLLTLAAAATAIVLPRDITAVNKDLQKIDADTKNLTTQVTKWNGQLGTVQPIMDAEKVVETDLNTANKNAPSYPTPSTSEAQQVVQYINNTLRVDIIGTLTALNNQKANFQKNGLTSVVKSNLNTLKNGTQTYGNTLLGKVSDSTTKSQGTSVLNAIIFQFNQAITNFS